VSISEKISQAYKWNTLSQVVNQVLLLAINIILVRILTPQDFGIIALPFIIFSLVRLVQDLGYSDVLLKSSENDKALHSTIYWLIVSMGVLLSIVFFLGLYLWGKVDLRIIGIYTLCIVIGSFCIGYEAILKKSFSFKTLFYVDLIVNIVSGIVGIVLAWKGHGWIALLIRTLLQYGLALAIYFVSVKWRPLSKLDLSLLKESRTFATINILDQILAYLSKNIDTFIIGLRFDKNQLGLYDRAYKLINLPIQQTSGALSKVMLPELNNQVDSDQPKQILSRNLLISSLIILPISLLLYINAECIILILFGNKWMTMLPIFKVFTLSAWFQTVLAIFNPYMVSKNNNGEYFTFSLLSKLSIIIGMVYFCLNRSDLQSIAFGYFILNMIVTIGILLLMHFHYCKGIISKSFLIEMSKILIGLAGIYFVYKAAMATTEIGCTAEVCLIPILGMSIYLLVLVGLQSTTLTEIKKIIRLSNG
jgi:teichuronic acid exporter